MLPVVNELARKAGHTLACAEDAQRLLERGEMVGVMPEGFKGIGKPFADRYKLQRFGRGGFVSTALRAGAPIVPCSIVGAEEIYPMIGNAKTLARLLGLPVLPDHADVPVAGAAGRGAAADEVDDPVRRADPDGRLSAGGGGGSDADVQPDGPGAGTDPAHALQAAGAAAVGVLLSRRRTSAAKAAERARIGRRRRRTRLRASRVLAVDAQAGEQAREQRREGDVRLPPVSGCRGRGPGRAATGCRPCGGSSRPPVLPPSRPSSWGWRGRRARGVRAAGVLAVRRSSPCRTAPGAPSEPDVPVRAEPGASRWRPVPSRVGGQQRAERADLFVYGVEDRADLVADVGELDGQPVAQLRPGLAVGLGEGGQRLDGAERAVPLVRLVQQPVALGGVVPHAGEGPADLAERLVVEVAASRPRSISRRASLSRVEAWSR